MADPRQDSTVAATVANSERWQAAVVLASSYLAGHPDHEFVILFVGSTPPRTNVCRVVEPDWLGIDKTEFLRMATCQPPDQLQHALTPHLLRRLLEEFQVAVFLAAEIQVHSSFADITSVAASRDIVLAPRSMTPLPLDGMQPDAEPFTFDRDFLAVGQGAKPFLDFWAERAKYRDRNWVDLVPGRFPYEPARDPGVAVAYWNAHERGLVTAPDGSVAAGGSPLRFFNFSGYDLDSPWLLSTDCRTRPRVLVSGNPAIRSLCDSYRAELLKVAPADQEPDHFRHLPDGSPLTTQMRELFHRAWQESGRAETQFGPTPEVPPHPFGADGGAAFKDWLASPSSPAERNAGLNRLLLAIWTSRPDLQVAFRAPSGADASGFRDWCRTHGMAEGLVPDWATPREPRPGKPPADEFGVNLAGYLTAEFGLGELGRIVHRVVRHAGVPVASVVERRSIEHTARATLDEPETTGEARFPVSILSVNADFTQVLLDSHPDLGHQRYRIGVWAWELDDFPPAMRVGFALVDEVWTISEFSRRAIAEHSPVPVRTIPLPVPDPGAVSHEPGDTVQFLFAFDFNSTGQRKNPWGVVTAFQRAFPGRDDVRLVIKATNGHLHVPAVERLRYAIGGDDRILLLERYLSVAELNDLYAGSDAYVSLHRSEGFGLTVAEAMVRGLPVIATDYSSTTELLDAGVGWPIPYELIEVGEGWPPYQADGMWADPDLDEAARAMRVVADDPAEARRRGSAAREHILRTRSMDAAADWVRTQLDNAYRTWQARQQPAGGPAGGLVRRAASAARRRFDRGGDR
jgi:glycosyltransferase involved in cell wall biosynthesis